MSEQIKVLTEFITKHRSSHLAPEFCTSKCLAEALLATGFRSMPTQHRPVSMRGGWDGGWECSCGAATLDRAGHMDHVLKMLGADR